MVSFIGDQARERTSSVWDSKVWSLSFKLRRSQSATVCITERKESQYSGRGECEVRSKSYLVGRTGDENVFVVRSESDSVDFGIVSLYSRGRFHSSSVTASIPTENEKR
jgi:hypothetical protein